MLVIIKPNKTRKLLPEYHIQYSTRFKEIKYETDKKDFESFYCNKKEAASISKVLHGDLDILTNQIIFIVKTHLDNKNKDQ